MRTNPTLNEVKTHAIRSAMVDNWNVARVHKRLVTELDLTHRQARKVCEWLALPIKGVGRDFPIGDEIRERRKAMGASRNELAEMAGVSLNALVKYERREAIPREETVEKVLLGLKRLKKRRYNQKQRGKR